MTRTLAVVAVVILAEAGTCDTARACQPELPADSLRSENDGVEERPVIAALRYSVMNISTRSGQRWTGLFAGTSGDSILLIDGMERVAIPYRELADVRIRKEQTSMQSVLPTMLLGTLGILLVTGQAQGQPVGYLEDTDDAILLSALGGVALASVAGMVERGADPVDVECTFSDNPAEAAAAWEELRGRVRGIRMPDIVHIGLQAARVATRLSRAHSGSFPWQSNSSNWNLLRRIQLTFSVTPFLQVGGAMIRLAEPDIRTWSYSSGGTIGVQSEVTESFSEGNLYGLVGVVELPPGLLPDWLVLRGGLAFGPTTIEYMYERTVFTYENSPPYASSVVRQTEQFEGTEFGYGIYGELGINITGLMSVSCILDYGVVPSRAFPAIPELQLPAEPLGNRSVGVLIGFHF